MDSEIRISKIGRIKISDSLYTIEHMENFPVLLLVVNVEYYNYTYHITCECELFDDVLEGGYIPEYDFVLKRGHGEFFEDEVLVESCTKIEPYSQYEKEQSIIWFKKLQDAQNKQPENRKFFQ